MELHNIHRSDREGWGLGLATALLVHKESGWLHVGENRVGRGLRCLDRLSALCCQVGTTLCFLPLCRSEILEFLPWSWEVNVGYITASNPACSVFPCLPLEFEPCLVLLAYEGRSFEPSKCHSASGPPGTSELYSCI